MVGNIGLSPRPVSDNLVSKFHLKTYQVVESIYFDQHPSFSAWSATADFTRILCDRACEIYVYLTVDVSRSGPRIKKGYSIAFDDSTVLANATSL